MNPFLFHLYHENSPLFLIDMCSLGESLRNSRPHNSVLTAVDEAQATKRHKLNDLIDVESYVKIRETVQRS